LLCVAPFDRGPGDAVRGFLLPWIARMGGKRVIEGLAVDVLRMRRKMVANCRRQINVLAIGIVLLLTSSSAQAI
jgi:hypothetical protein